MLSLVPRGSPGCRAEQAAELAAQGAMELASFPEGRPGRRNVGSWQRGRPTPQPGALCCRRAAGAGQGAHGRSLSGSPRGCGRGIDTTGCASTLEQRPPPPPGRGRRLMGGEEVHPGRRASDDLSTSRSFPRPQGGSRNGGRGVEVAKRGRRNPEQWGQDTCATREGLKARGQVAGGHLREGQHGSRDGSHCVPPN